MTLLASHLQQLSGNKDKKTTSLEIPRLVAPFFFYVIGYVILCHHHYFLDNDLA